MRHHTSNFRCLVLSKQKSKTQRQSVYNDKKQHINKYRHVRGWKYMILVQNNNIFVD